MGNMLFSKRLTEDTSSADMRLLPSHMYNGPLSLGDPNYRGLSKMEEDPLIPQRMREIVRTIHCLDESNKFDECGKEHGGFKGIIACQEPCNQMKECIAKYFHDTEFRNMVTEEYLNERSHYRQTGIKTPRYIQKEWQNRDLVNDPPFDENGKYIPQKPNGWDKSYKETGPPSWASYNYNFNS
ncbi:COX assembly mitochondrial protein homolog [Lepeophtheirus salmonis]|uniref:COX assembly mitochondrial protein homolog n=1 Tax=Lepeophtheirus salmonis TaxID=72036 RepID=UPI001AE42533|nr:COX assembly mitochondrial protein homolog [Lepeophtheirus salmonis]XP_040577065.1 COX assembly mitochondrial protein homolog [Lepeophtheirus salmonis]